MSQEGDECCTTSMHDIQNRCKLIYFILRLVFITHNNNVIEKNINVSTFDILSVRKPHTRASNMT